MSRDSILSKITRVEIVDKNLCKLEHESCHCLYLGTQHPTCHPTYHATILMGAMIEYLGRIHQILLK